jgi:DNA polymerase-3 subunit delta
MTPEEFSRQIQKQPLAPAYLFLGPEMWQREQCRHLLFERALPAEDRESGFVRYDLDESDLNSVMDDARSMSLFASNRLIWASSAEGVLPRGRGAAQDSDEAEETAKSDAAPLIEYLKDPPPGTVVVFDCSRYDFEGEDKTKLQRVQKFFAHIKAQVEFPNLSPMAARKLALTAARDSKVEITSDAIDLLVEVLDANASRIVNEIEKLSLYANAKHKITVDDVVSLVPNGRATTIFSLVAALGRGDRTGALDALDILVREGEYLPLALTFLGTQFRLALVAKEAGLTNAGMIQAHFSKLGVPMWRSRAEQVQQTLTVFSPEKLRGAIRKTFETDRALRDARPDDRTVMERFVLSLT